MTFMLPFFYFFSVCLLSPPFQPALCTQAGALYIALKLSVVFKNASLVKFCWEQLHMEGLLQSEADRDCKSRQGATTVSQMEEGKRVASMGFL